MGKAIVKDGLEKSALTMRYAQALTIVKSLLGLVM